MDEALGGCLGIVAIGAAIVWVITMILKGLALAFLASAQFFGHPSVVLALFGFAGVVGGLLKFRRKHGSTAVLSSEDYAEIAGIRLVPEAWAWAIMSVLFMLILVFGFVRQ